MNAVAKGGEEDHSWYRGCIQNCYDKGTMSRAESKSAGIACFYVINDVLLIERKGSDGTYLVNIVLE